MEQQIQRTGGARTRLVLSASKARQLKWVYVDKTSCSLLLANSCALAFRPSAIRRDTSSTRLRSRKGSKIRSVAAGVYARCCRCIRPRLSRGYALRAGQRACCKAGAVDSVQGACVPGGGPRVAVTLDIRSSWRMHFVATSTSASRSSCSCSTMSSACPSVADLEHAIWPRHTATFCPSEVGPRQNPSRYEQCSKLWL